MFTATCGGGGISPTFGAALWIIDYAIQAALNGVERLYFHQGTIGNCVSLFPFCIADRSLILAFVIAILLVGQVNTHHVSVIHILILDFRFTVGAPYYGVAFVSEFLGKDGQKVIMLDDGTGPVASYAVYNAAGMPVRLLIYNSNYFDGTGTRSHTSVSFTGGPLPTSGTVSAKRLTAPNATSRVDQGAAVTIGGAGAFSSTCTNTGTQAIETIMVAGGAVAVTVQASEALIVFL